MPLYQNSIIYKLVHQNDLENENIYIGSTTNFRMRKNCHKCSCRNENDKKYNMDLYQYIRDNGDWDEWQMIPIEVYSCNNKKELEVRERYHIELLKSKLNQVIPTRTGKEWYDINKQTIAQQSKQYRENNKEKVLQRHREYNSNNKEKIKDYYEKNKEEILRKHREYNLKHKEQINEKRNNNRIKCCICGTEICKHYLKLHQKTKKCVANTKIDNQFLPLIVSA